MKISAASLYPKRAKGGIATAIRYSSLESQDVKSFISQMLLASLLLSFTAAVLLLYFLGLSGWPLLIALVISFVVSHIAIYSWLLLSADAKSSFVEAILPDVLRLVASNLRSGLTVDRALMQAAREEFGPLKDAIDLAGRKIATGMSEDKAFRGMLERIKSENLERAIDLIAQGIRSGGQLAGILDKIADVFRNRSLLNKEMRSSVLMYAIFIFFVLALGAPILFGISDYLVNTTMKGIAGKVPEISSQVVVVGSTMPMQSMGAGVDPGFMTMYLLIALTVSSITGSIVLGQILYGREKAGLKFIPILITLSIVLFFAIKYLLSLTLGQMINVPA